MASLSFGNSSSSALIKSANTAASQIASYNDSLAEYEYQLSAKTDDDLQTYQNYLNKRIDTLNTSGTVTDASKALSLTKSLTSAISTNTSTNITRENIQIMAGNGTLTDKYNTIVSQYQRAVGIGDDALAQSLESQAYSVSQSIQSQAQTAADAATALAKAGASSTAGSQEHIATNLQVSLQQLNNDIKNSGQKDFNSTVAKWVSTNSSTLTALGVALPKGAQPNYFDIVNGVAGAIYNAHMLAYSAELPYNPDSAQTYYNDAMKLATGISTLPTLAGAKSVQDIQEAAADPARFAYDEASGKFVQTQQTGNQVTQTGQVQPTYSGSVNKAVVLSPQQTAQMTKFGLNFDTQTGGTVNNGVRVQSTDATPPWLSKILGKNGVTNAYSVNGNLQFEADSASGTGKAVYTIVSDPSGKHGVYESDNTGDRLLGGDQGFNDNPATSAKQSQGFLSRLGNSVENSAGNILGGALGLFGGHANASALINAGQSQLQIAAANAAAARAMVSAAPSPLPDINTNPIPQSQNISIPVAPATQSVVPQTMSVQKPNVNVQGGKVGVQGGSVNLNSGGSIRI